MKHPNAVVNGCFHFFLTWAAKEKARDFFDRHVEPQDVANNGANYLQKFLASWSMYIELEKQGDNDAIIVLLCTMIHSAETDLPLTPTDEQRLGPLALEFDCRFPAMRGAFVELTRH
jgi:hypothetical protein